MDTFQRTEVLCLGNENGKTIDAMFPVTAIDEDDFDSLTQEVKA